MQHLVRGASRPMILFIFGLTILTGCRSDNRAGEDQHAAIPGDAATYQLRGIVVSSDAAKGIVTIDTEAIPGLMGAMTMP
jgi:protein SCO1